MTGMRLPANSRGEEMSLVERILSIGLGAVLLSRLARRRSRWGLLLAVKGVWLVGRGIRGRSLLYRMLQAEPGGLTPFDRRFRVYLSTTIQRPVSSVREVLVDGAAVRSTCPELSAQIVGQAVAGDAGLRDWEYLLSEHSDGEVILLHLGGDGLSHLDTHLAIELRPAHGGAATELRLLLRYHPPWGVVGRIVHGSPQARIQRDLDHLRQVLEVGVAADASGSRGRGRRSVITVIDQVAEEHLP